MLTIVITEWMRPHQRRCDCYLAWRLWPFLGSYHNAGVFYIHWQCVWLFTCNLTNINQIILIRRNLKPQCMQVRYYVLTWSTSTPNELVSYLWKFFKLANEYFKFKNWLQNFQNNKPEIDIQIYYQGVL